MGKRGSQIDKSGSSDIGRDELGGDLDSCEQQSEVAGCCRAQTHLIMENMSATALSTTVS